MPISPGSKIGPYEVVAPLGEGGMGVVYRGRDTRLNREVALKLLPDHFANDPDRLSRFQREAQLLASLNHANIAQIYGLEQAEGSTCIVMELVEGETLAERLKKGPLAHDEALDIARQIADALAAAHERGIVHRDLKPANIKLTRNGTVKVLDFGLAKSLGPRASDILQSSAPTLADGSVIGSVVGTPGYMSPEQARGKEVDARTDIWAFGCVLFEMLTARQAFDGETATDVMAKIVTSPPDLELLPKDTPSSTRLLLAAVLNKNSTQRLQHIGDSRLFLDGTLTAATTKADAAPNARGIRGRLPILALVAALIIVAIPAVLYFRTVPQPASQMRFEISFSGLANIPSVSPDGRMFAYVAQPPDAKRTLWVRPIGAETGQQLSGTEDVSGFLWCVDSRRIAFVANGKLRKIDVASGTSQIITDIGGTLGAAWNGNGAILVARTSDNVISRVSDSGGELKPITKLDTGRKEFLQAFPVFLPDGKHFLYVAAAGKPEDSGIFLSELDSDKAPERVIALQPMQFNYMTYVSPGYFLAVMGGRLSAWRMDATGHVGKEDPIVVADGIEGSFSVSNTGLLIYRKASPVAGKQLMWFEHSGKPIGPVGAVANYGGVDLSPKGDRAAVDITTSNNRDIWVMDLNRAVPSRITFDAASDWTAIWSPNGEHLGFASNGRSGASTTQIIEKSSSGAGMESPLTDGVLAAIPVDWSPDDKYIVFSRPKPKVNAVYDTWLLPTSGDTKPVLFLETPFDKGHARISPDGRWIAYITNESGSYQIVVQTFPNANGGKWPITSEGGVEPKWRRDSHELYYLAPDGKLMSVSIGGTTALQAGRPVALFQTPLTVNKSSPDRTRRYDVAPDGRFLMVVPASTSAALPINVVVNWNSAIEKTN